MAGRETEQAVVFLNIKIQTLHPFTVHNAGVVFVGPSPFSPHSESAGSKSRRFLGESKEREEPSPPPGLRPA